MTTFRPRRELSEPVAAEVTDVLARAIVDHAAAMTRVGIALEAVANEVRTATVQRKPVDEFFAGASMRLDRLCHWMKVRGPWLLASMPIVLVAVQAISPEAGRALAAILREVSS
jgi:hypothetical protein